MREKADADYLSCYAGVIENNYIYTVDRFYGALMEYNKETFSYRILTWIDCINPGNLGFCVRKMIKDGDDFYFFLENSRDFLIWSQTKQSFRIYGNENQYNQNAVVVSNAFLIQRDIWIYPGYSNQPLRCFHVETGEIEEYPSMEQKLAKEKIALEQSQFVLGTVQNETLWFVIYNTPYLISFDTVSHEWTVYSFGKEELLCNICYDGRDMWICFIYKNTFINWSPEYGVTDTYQISDSGLNMGIGDPFNFIYGFGDRIFTIPMYDNPIYMIDKKTKEEHFLVSFDKDCHTNTRKFLPLFYTYVVDGNQLILLPHIVNVFVKINMDTCQVQLIDTKKKEADREHYLDICLKSGCVMESVNFSLEGYLDYLKSNDIDYEEQKETYSRGKAIFHNTKKL